MKKNLLFLLLIVAVNQLSAQSSKHPPFRDFLAKRNQFSPNADQRQITVMPPVNIFPKDVISPVPQASLDGRILSPLLQNGNKIYILPQDNMPCIVPDESPYNMPVIPGVLDIDKGIYVPFFQNKIGPR